VPGWLWPVVAMIVVALAGAVVVTRRGRDGIAAGPAQEQGEQ
jgi:hypothetical protein